MRVAGLFAGIGGLELGLNQAGHHAEFLCELDPAAKAVLSLRFPGVPLQSDIRSVQSLPDVEMIAAGFPCQDLSQAGRTAGISGRQSGLVNEVFRLVDRASQSFRWLLLENVPFMLQLDGGRAMTHLVSELESRGFTWAYRVVDTRAFGLPQRRQRVILLAARDEDPRAVLFSGNHDEPEWQEDASLAFGFYWTEGLRGLGAAIDAVPTLKGGSTLGIPSPPAILMPRDGGVVTPDIRDAERLQGFPACWTDIGGKPDRNMTSRWKLVGNAVSVPVARWIGDRLSSGDEYRGEVDLPFRRERAKWPKTAAWGRRGETYFVDATMWPVRDPYAHLHEFLAFPTFPLSSRATAGFLRRLLSGSLSCYPDGFVEKVSSHLELMQTTPCLVKPSSREASLSGQ